MSARVWTVWASTVGGAAAVAVPYAGLGWPDAGWAAVAGGSAALAVFRWRDYREAAAEPGPAALPPGRSLGQRIAPVVGPGLAPLIDRPRRVPVRAGSAAAPHAVRLNAATRTLAPMLGRLGPHAGDTAQEARRAHAALREVAERIRMVERTLAISPDGAAQVLTTARDGLVGQLADGVGAYERLATSAAECVAALARGGDRLAAQRLHEASDALSGFASGLGEMTDRNTEYGLSG